MFLINRDPHCSAASALYCHHRHHHHHPPQPHPPASRRFHRGLLVGRGVSLLWYRPGYSESRWPSLNTRYTCTVVVGGVPFNHQSMAWRACCHEFAPSDRPRLLVLQSRFGDKTLGSWLVCPPKWDCGSINRLRVKISWFNGSMIWY